MEYIVRLRKVILAVLCFIARMILRVLIILGLSIQMITIFFLTPVVLVLELIELVTIKPIYYIITGKKYTDTFNSVINMFGDLIVCGKIFYRIENETYCCHDDWYKEKWDGIENIKVTLYPQKENEE